MNTTLTSLISRPGRDTPPTEMHNLPLFPGTPKFTSFPMYSATWCSIVASNVIRQSTLTGMQGDAAYLLNDRHTVRAGFSVTGEQTNVTNDSTVMPGQVGAVTGPAFNITDKSSLLGW